MRVSDRDQFFAVFIVTMPGEEEPISGQSYAAAAASGLNRELTPRQLAAAAVLVVGGMAFAGLYLLYPPPDELLDEISDIRLGTYDAVEAIDATETARRVAQWRTQLDKLPTAVRIRGGSVSASQLQTLVRMRHALETAEAAVRDAARDDASSTAPLKARLFRRHLEDSHRDCTAAFRTDDYRR